MGIGHMRPASRGTIRLASADPAATPLIDPAYLAEKSDVDALITGVEVVAKLADTGAFDEWGGRCDHTDLLKLDRRDLEKAIADGVSRFFHLSGPCRMGSNAVDSVLQHECGDCDDCREGCGIAARQGLHRCGGECFVKSE
jgi:choline dehydrogenase